MLLAQTATQKSLLNFDKIWVTWFSENEMVGKCLSQEIKIWTITSQKTPAATFSSLGWSVGWHQMANNLFVLSHHCILQLVSAHIHTTVPASKKT